MEKNYYPLRIGKELGNIVSDVPTRTYVNKTDEESQVNRDGGHFVCESVANQTLVQQLINAYNEKYAPKQLPIKTIIVDKDIPLCRLNFLIQIVDNSGNVYVEFKRDGNLIFYAPKEVKENSAHSFTEGSEAHQASDYPTPTIDDQIEMVASLLKTDISEGRKVLLRSINENLLGIKRWSQNPLWSKLDVEKVIEDLIAVIHVWEQTGSYSTTDKTSSIQNAEAALGMLQAFKEKRASIGTPLQKNYEVKIPPLKDRKPQHINDESKNEISYTLIIRTLRKSLQDIEAPGNVNAIIWGIEELIKKYTST